MFTLFEKGVKAGICSDHAGYELKSIVEGYLEANDVEYEDFGTHSADSCDYADFAHPMASALEEGKVFPGIAICGSGQGMAITLNKHQGIRAALCWSKPIAELARKHNNANVLVLPGRFLEPAEALEILDVFMTTPFEGGRHERRINKMPLPKA